MIKNFHVRPFMTPTILWEVNWTHGHMWSFIKVDRFYQTYHGAIPDEILYCIQFPIVHRDPAHLNSFFFVYLDHKEVCSVFVL